MHRRAGHTPSAAQSRHGDPVAARSARSVPGDVVWIPPGVEHWLDATTLNGMTHIAIQEAVDGKVVNRLERVEYG